MFPIQVFPLFICQHMGEGFTDLSLSSTQGKKVSVQPRFTTLINLLIRLESG